jgi:hypothetical protein
MKPHTFLAASGKLLCTVLLGTVTFLSGCKKDPEPVTPGAPGPEAPATGVDPLTATASVATTIAGSILDETGQPLPGVRVKIAGGSALTSPEGTFMLENVNVPGNRCVITCEKAGYFNAVWAGTPAKEGLTLTRIVMTAAATTHTIPAATGGTAALPNGSAVQLPAGGVVTSSGAAYSGTVNLAVQYQDPSSAGFASVVAGGDLLARRTDGSTRLLYSYGILRVKLTGSGGEDLQVAPGKTAALTIDVPESQMSTAPATIPLWFFDETAGVWKEEGEATRQGDKYVGTVKHFTDWNADHPTGWAIVRGRVLDCEGNPIKECPVMIGQILTYTQGDGTFVQRVPTGTALPVTVTPFNDLFYGKMIHRVEPLGEGEEKNVGDMKSPDDFCAGTVEGSIKTRSGDAVKYISFQSPAGSMALYRPGASFEAKLPGNTSITMKVYTDAGYVFTKTFQSGATKTKMDLGEIDLSNPAVTVHAIVTCGNLPLGGATAKFDWAGGSATATSNADGDVAAKIPTGQQVTVTISHAKGTRTTTFSTSAPAGGEQSLGVINLCAVTTPAGTNSFVMSGDGFKNALKTLAYSTKLSETHYDENLMFPNTTSVDVRDQSDTLRVVLQFAGKTTGAVNQATQPRGTIQRTLSNGKTITYFANEVYEGTQLNITVTRYDAVGGLIEGTYSGTFKGEGQSGQSVTITVTDGKFSAVRGSDVKM